MKINLSQFLSRCACLSLLACQTQAVSIVYSTIGECREKIENVNAAFSELACKSVGNYQVDIKQQSPQYFTITVAAKGTSASSELETITQELPMEPGKVIEWHLVDKQPKFMIFRLKMQVGQVMTEYLTLSLVTLDRICPIATIETAKNPNSNQKARDLITEKFSALAECPTSVVQF